MSNLTSAYIAIGAHSALRACTDPTALANLIERYSGELNLIDELISDGEMLDALAAQFAEGLTGVFVYEVAEPYGEQMVGILLKGQLPDRSAIATKLLADIAIA